MSRRYALFVCGCLMWPRPVPLGGGGRADVDVWTTCILKCKVSQTSHLDRSNFLPGPWPPAAAQRLVRTVGRTAQRHRPTAAPLRCSVRPRRRHRRDQRRRRAGGRAAGRGGAAIELLVIVRCERAKRAVAVTVVRQHRSRWWCCRDQISGDAAAVTPVVRTDLATRAL